jgi:hypothetical protein
MGIYSNVTKKFANDEPSFALLAGFGVRFKYNYEGNLIIGISVWLI